MKARYWIMLGVLPAIGFMTYHSLNKNPKQTNETVQTTQENTSDSSEYLKRIESLLNSTDSLNQKNNILKESELQDTTLDTSITDTSTANESTTTKDTPTEKDSLDTLAQAITFETIAITPTDSIKDGSETKIAIKDTIRNNDIDFFGDNLDIVDSTLYVPKNFKPTLINSIHDIRNPIGIIYEDLDGNNDVDVKIRDVSPYYWQTLSKQKQKKGQSNLFYIYKYQDGTIDGMIRNVELSNDWLEDLFEASENQLMFKIKQKPELKEQKRTEKIIEEIYNMIDYEMPEGMPQPSTFIGDVFNEVITGDSMETYNSAIVKIEDKKIFMITCRSLYQERNFIDNNADGTLDAITLGNATEQELNEKHFNSLAQTFLDRKISLKPLSIMSEAKELMTEYARLSYSIKINLENNIQDPDRY